MAAEAESKVKSSAAVRGVILAALLVAGVGLFVALTGRHYAVQRWLFWRYLGYWAAALSWLGCVGLFGCWLLAKLRLRLARLEFLTLGLALGVLGFGLSIFVLGLLHLLYPPLFVLLPLGLAGLGARWAWERRAVVVESVRAVTQAKIGAGGLLLGALGTLGALLVYVQILTPDVLSFDVRWYHYPLAQRYALSHAVERTGEGFWMSAYPQLSTYLYCWAFLAPLPLLFDRMGICTHIEVVLFLATLAQIPVLVRELVPGARAWSSWALRFAFPGVFVYDSNLNGGADHVAAFFAIPIAMCFWRAARHFEWKGALLFSVFLSAAALTKYTAVIIVVPAAVGMLVAAVYWCVRRRDRRALLAFAMLCVAPLVLTAPHWLKNWLWYADPMYPAFHRFLPSTPWSPDALVQYQILEGVSRPGSLTPKGILQALESTLTFSFVANDWYELKRGVPFFGSLFTLTLPCLVFIRGGRRLVWLYALSMLSVFVWYVLSHYERFLVAVAPWMVAATAACLVRIWREGPGPRLAMVALVGLQAISGSDAAFVRTHNQIGDSPLRRSALFIASGFEKVKNRLSFFEPLPTLGAATPKDAVVLAHDVMMILGIDRNWITDLHQSKISYGSLLEPAAIDRELKSLGVTHLVWPEWAVGRDSLAGDLAFLNYALNYTKEEANASGVHLSSLPKDTPRKLGGAKVAMLACDSPFRNGWYELAQLAVPTYGPAKYPRRQRPIRDVASASDADYIVWNPSCQSGSIPPGFKFGNRRGNEHLYVRDQRQSVAR